MFAFGVNSGAYVAEIIRGGIASIDPGQAEACLLYTSRVSAKRFGNGYSTQAVSIVLQHRDAFHIRPDILLNALHIINDRLQIYAKIKMCIRDSV